MEPSETTPPNALSAAGAVPISSASQVLNYAAKLHVHPQVESLFRTHRKLRIYFLLMTGINLFLLIKMQKINLMVRSNPFLIPTSASDLLDPGVILAALILGIWLLGFTLNLLRLISRLYNPWPMILLSVLAVIPWVGLLPFLLVNHKVTRILLSEGFSIMFLGIWIQRPQL